MENMEQQKDGQQEVTEQRDGQTGTGEGQHAEKLFTQDDVNRIVGERVARVKTETSPQVQERVQALSKRELQLDAREMLADAGLPKELINAINCNSKEEMQTSINTLKSLYGNINASTPPQRLGYRVSTGVYGSSAGGEKSDDESIRAAMGLKG